MPAPMWLYSIPGVVMVLLSIPLILRRVPPNPFYGLRIPVTFKDEAVWYDANAASGRDLAILGAGVTLLNVVLQVAGVRDMAFAVCWTAAFAGGAICTGVLGWVRANRMFRERQTRAR